MRIATVVACAATACAATACAPTTFTPPEWPKHDQEQDDFLHALGRDFPFLCPEPGSDPARPQFGTECAVRQRSAAGSTAAGVAAAAADDADAFLSCDAIGCHGEYDYRAPGGAVVGRHVLGSEGPSCYACHERKWNKQEPKSGRFAFKAKGGED